MVPAKGWIVCATAGRDAGTYFVIVEVSGSRVLIADGKSRRLSHPKAKNRKHLRMTGDQIALEQVTDKSLRRMLRAYAAQKNENGEGIDVV